MTGLKKDESQKDSKKTSNVSLNGAKSNDSLHKKKMSIEAATERTCEKMEEASQAPIIPPKMTQSQEDMRMNQESPL